MGNQLLIVHPHLTVFGGAEILLSHFTTELVNSGVEVKIVSLSLSDECKKHFHSSIDFIIPEHPMTYGLRSTSVFSSLQLVPEIYVLRKLLKKHCTMQTIVNVHNFPSTWAMSAIPNRKIVWMCNEPPALWNNQNPSFLLKMIYIFGSFIDKLLVNKFVSDIIVSDEVNFQRVFNLYNRKPKIINYGVDFEFFSKKGKPCFRNEKNVEDSFLILHVGVFSHQKNQKRSVELLKNLKPKIPNAKLVYAGIGDNEYEIEVKKLINNYGLENDVIFVGHVSRNKIKDLYHSSNVAVFPTKSQGGWLSPFEAISSDVPVIVDPEMTASKIIINNNLCYVTDKMEDVILDLFHNPDNFHIRFSNAQNWIQKNISWKFFTEKMLENLNHELSTGVDK